MPPRTWPYRVMNLGETLGVESARKPKGLERISAVCGSRREICSTVFGRLGSDITNMVPRVTGASRYGAGYDSTMLLATSLASLSQQLVEPRKNRHWDVMSPRVGPDRTVEGRMDPALLAGAAYMDDGPAASFPSLARPARIHVVEVAHDQFPFS